MHTIPCISIDSEAARVPRTTAQTMEMHGFAWSKNGFA